jgi:hypothetical protein
MASLDIVPCHSGIRFISSLLPIRNSRSDLLNLLEAFCVRGDPSMLPNPIPEADSAEPEH